VYILGGITISWASKKGATIFLFSIEEEYMACIQATKEALSLEDS
jgi:hypothetical protein